MSNGAPAMTFYGNLTADPELRFTPSGQAVVNFTVASTERKYDKQTSEWVEGDTTFLRCTVWGQAAENVAETLTKGTRVIVTGSLRVRQYETKEGKQGTSVECNVEEVGPSLKWASARVDRNQTKGATNRASSRSGGGSQRDPWSSGGDDAPPF